MLKLVPLLLCGVALLSGRPAAAADEVLSPETRAVPGRETPTPLLEYRNTNAAAVHFAGEWDLWTERFKLQHAEGKWSVDVRGLKLPPGRHEYKFLVDGQFESGDNRVLYINDEHMLEAPPDVIRSATIENFNNIQVAFRHGVRSADGVRVRLEPETPITWRLLSERDIGYPAGYTSDGNTILFLMDEKTYGLNLSPYDPVVVAGSFTGWEQAAGNPNWKMQDNDNDGIWELRVPAGQLQLDQGKADYLFKFLVHGSQWLHPPEHAPNRVDDGRGNVNLHLDPRVGGSTRMEVLTTEPLDLSRRYSIVIEGIHPRTVRDQVTPGGVLYQLYSDKTLGVILDKKNKATTYRLFAPRATKVQLNLFDSPYHEKHQPSYRKLDPVETYTLWRAPDGVWEITLLGLDTGRYYGFRVDGPSGDGEGFFGDSFVGDPYARAAAHAENCAIVIDPEATNEWFSGWTDHDWKTPAYQDLNIYEAHVRDLTMDPSSRVEAPLRGTYAGLVSTLGKGTGLDHIKHMGFNAIEFLPINEFNNGTDEYNWGYTTVYYFAPEASFARDPLRGSQYYEFKSFVNELHNAGIAVILDVVYNHVGVPNYFSLIDRKYYFRLDASYGHLNFSGCGNDFKTESPMARRLIVDNVKYFLEEFRVDGFRFDLAELIDLDTMWAIRDAARAIKPDVILISEPWSLRGQNKQALRGTGWAAWNNDYRYASKDFIRGRGNREWLAKNIFGSLETWTATPLQSVNYMESHDDMALVDEITTAPGHDGRVLIEQDVAANRLGAVIVYTSLGIPMVCEGQEFLRSKHGVHNSYNRGDKVNALNYEDRDRPLAAQAMEYYRQLALLRASEAGASFRVSEVPPPGYYTWIWPENPRAFGYTVNAPRMKKSGNGFVVLLNASTEPVAFQVNLAPGNWKQIANGETILPAGLPGATPLQGAQTISVPGVSAAIFMDGF